jgi:chaperone required for assembly of F1-ATPase
VTKRFYCEAAVTPLDDGQWGVTLDRRPIRTPAGALLSVPTEALARAIAAEWEAQAEDVRPSSMPMMRFAATVVDRIGREREAVVEQITAYGGSDLLCYRADIPRELAERQEKVWQPLLDWLAEAHGALLKVTAGVTPVAQTPEALAAMQDVVVALDDWRMSAVSQITASSGSLALALAAAEGRIGAAEAAAASQLDDIWQVEKWGEDKEAEERRQALAAEIDSAVRFLDLLDG